MREQHERAARLWAEQWESAIELRKSHVEETHCVLSDEWAAHFRSEAAREDARFATLELRLDELLAEARVIKKVLAEGPRALNARYASLMATPPQGVFEFRGSLHFLPDTGHTLMVSANGDPIWETLRRATGEENVEARMISERNRQIPMFPGSETGLESQSDLEAAPSPASGSQNATKADSDEIPF